MSTTDSLWPDFMSGEMPTPPKLIMRHQAEMLGEMTGGRILGLVNTKVLGKDFVHNLYIVTPELDDYQHLVLRVRHQMSQIYPVRVSMSEKEERSKECNSEAEFVELMKRILSHPQTAGALRMLNAQTST